MDLQKNIRTKGAAILLLTLSFLIYSCKKDNETIVQKGPATVIVNLLGVESNTEELIPDIGAKSAKFASMSASADKTVSGAVYSEGVQTQVVPFDDNLSIVATLTPADMPVKSEVVESRNLVASAAPKGTAGQIVAATPVQKPLDNGVKYRIIVYNSTGTVIPTNGNQVYTYGGTPPSFALDGGSTYTFVIYSLNNTTNPPDVTGDNLSAASVNNVAGDLMYFKKTLTVIKGDNYLDAVLKHQFSQITTKIELDATVIGNLMAAGISSGTLPTIQPEHANASIKLLNDVLTYNGNPTAAGASVIFPSISPYGVRTITSTPTLIISPATANGQFTISTITIGAVTKQNIVLNNLNITPGHRYNLNLMFQSPCTEIVYDDNSNFGWEYAAGAAPAGGVSNTFNAPAADYGFTFDITELDNSFNMTINGTPLISKAGSTNHEIQFQGSVDDHERNIQFASDEKWWGNGPSQIYNLKTGTGIESNPVIRVVIGPNGDVFMYGKRSNDGELEPLKLFNDYEFNKITWNSNSANEIVVSQHIVGATAMKGRGEGRKIIPCP